jgi:response regulator RpfG family c-di-GMP phosphodiesterase
MKPHSSHPTVLLTNAASKTNAWLAGELRQTGYLVLESHDDTEALELVRLHSRTIHVMLTADGENNRALAARLHRYRPLMRMLFIGPPTSESVRDTVPPDLVMQTVREIVEPSWQKCASAGAGAA